MELESSSPLLQKHATYACSEPDQSSPRFSILFHEAPL